MDVTTVIIGIVTVADGLIQRCKEAKQCQHEAARLGLRIQNLLGTLDEAARAFNGDRNFEKNLVKLEKFLDTLPPLLEKAKQPAKMMSKVMWLSKSSELAETLQNKEAILEDMCEDLGLAMMPSIAQKLDDLPAEMEARLSSVVETGVSTAVTAAMQQREKTEQMLLRKILDEQDGKTEMIVRQTISAYIAQLGTGDDSTRGGGMGMGGVRGAVGGSAPLCQGHKRVCALRTVQKEGANKGRQFYCCAYSRADQCKTFIWVDEMDQRSGRSNLGGTGSSNGGQQEKGDGRLCAGHKEPCAFRTVRKEGANKGRQFYTCARPDRERCSTFTWADEDSGSSSRGRNTVNDVGMGSGTTRGRARENVPLCEGHQEMCVLRTVRKKGPNEGRQFYTCPRYQKQQCNTFLWV